MMKTKMKKNLTVRESVQSWEKRRRIRNRGEERYTNRTHYDSTFPPGSEKAEVPLWEALLFLLRIRLLE